ncbi:MAG: hypothetical protein AAF989_09710 [Planctomycetota bacterium]
MFDPNPYQPTVVSDPEARDHDDLSPVPSSVTGSATMIGVAGALFLLFGLGMIPAGLFSSLSLLGIGCGVTTMGILGIECSHKLPKRSARAWTIASFWCVTWIACSIAIFLILYLDDQPMEWFHFLFSLPMLLASISVLIALFHPATRSWCTSRPGDRAR